MTNLIVCSLIECFLVCVVIEESNLDRQCPLAASVLDLALQTVEFKDTWVKHEHVVTLFKVLLGKFVQV